MVRTDTRVVDRTAAAVVSGRTGEGNLWIACYGAGEVRRYAPDGTLTGVVEVGAPNVTCPAFVGPGPDRLLITTARSDGDRDSGRLFLAASVPSACP